MIDGTVLSAGQAFELGSAVQQCLPRDISGQEAQYWFGHTGKLSVGLRKLLLIDLAPPANLAEILGQQIEMLVGIKAHEQLDLNQGTYYQQLRQAVDAFSWSEELARIDLKEVVLVDHRFTGDFLAEAVGITCNIDPDKCMDYQGITIPNHPYVIQCQPGPKYQAKPPFWCLKNFHRSERGMTVHGGLSWSLYQGDQLVERLQRCCPDLPGSIAPNGNVPYLRLSDGQPDLRARYDGYAYVYFGSAS